jgi:hypothetical protein
MMGHDRSEARAEIESKVVQILQQWRSING